MLLIAIRCTGVSSASRLYRNTPMVAFLLNLQLRLHMPAVLKTVVLKDCEHVTQTGLLLPLPRPAHHRPSVKEVLEKYKAKAAAEIESEGKEAEDAKAAKLETLTEVTRVLSRLGILLGIFISNRQDEGWAALSRLTTSMLFFPAPVADYEWAGLLL